jgi:hypothetical protein
LDWPQRHRSLYPNTMSWHCGQSQSPWRRDVPPEDMSEPAKCVRPGCIGGIPNGIIPIPPMPMPPMPIPGHPPTIVFPGKCCENAASPPGLGAPQRHRSLYPNTTSLQCGQSQSPLRRCFSLRPAGGGRACSGGAPAGLPSGCAVPQRHRSFQLKTTSPHPGQSQSPSRRVIDVGVGATAGIDSCAYPESIAQVTRRPVCVRARARMHRRGRAGRGRRAQVRVSTTRSADSARGKDDVATLGADPIAGLHLPHATPATHRAHWAIYAREHKAHKSPRSLPPCHRGTQHALPAGARGGRGCLGCVPGRSAVAAPPARPSGSRRRACSRPVPQARNQRV